MKTKVLWLCLFLSALATVYVIGAYARRSSRPAIYDETADGSKQIASALAVAQNEHKRVLLQLGANWCGWCHQLHRIFASDPAIAAKLKSAYMVAEIDVDKKHNKNVDAKYGNPTRFGLPVILILDAGGTVLTTKNTAELEEGSIYDSARVLAFLNEWSTR
jgi:thiol:disulfide interchange protein